MRWVVLLVLVTSGCTAIGAVIGAKIADASEGHAQEGWQREQDRRAWLVTTGYAECARLHASITKQANAATDERERLRLLATLPTCTWDPGPYRPPPEPASSAVPVIIGALVGLAVDVAVVIELQDFKVGRP